MDLSGFEPAAPSMLRSTNIDEYKLFEHLEIIKLKSISNKHFYEVNRYTGINEDLCMAVVTKLKKPTGVTLKN